MTPFGHTCTLPSAWSDASRPLGAGYVVTPKRRWLPSFNWSGLGTWSETQGGKGDDDTAADGPQGMDQPPPIHPWRLTLPRQVE